MIFAFRLTLTGSPQQLSNVVPKFNEVRFSTPANSGVVYLADTPAGVEAVSNRFAIPAGKVFPFKISDLSQLWANGTTGDCLDMITETEQALLDMKEPVPEIKQEGGQRK